MLLLSSTSTFPVTQASLLASSSSSSQPSSSLSSSLSQTEAGIPDGNSNNKSEEERSKMSRSFIGWMVFACLDFFFFVPGGFLLAILGYNCQSTAMMVSGAILIFVFFIVIPGFGLSLVIRKQYRDTNKFINMTNRSRRESSTSQVAPLSCVVSTSGNNFHDFSRTCSQANHQSSNPGLVDSEVSFVDYRSCHVSDATQATSTTSPVATIVTIDSSAITTAEATSMWSNNFLNIFASRTAGQRCGYVELP